MLKQRRHRIDQPLTMQGKGERCARVGQRGGVSDVVNKLSFVDEVCWKERGKIPTLGARSSDPRGKKEGEDTSGKDVNAGIGKGGYLPRRAKGRGENSKTASSSIKPHAYLLEKGGGKGSGCGG